jgi:two-component system chemotaxis sensor kinase CheA
LTSSVDLKQFLSGFLAEAEEHLSSAHRNLMLAEKSLAEGEPSPRAVRELFRSLHTMKGLAGMVGVEPIVDLSHAMETALRTAESAGGRLSGSALELLMKGLAAIEERVRALSNGHTPKAAPTALLSAFDALEFDVRADDGRLDSLLTLDAALSSKLTAAEKQQFKVGISAGKRVLRVDFTPSPSRTDALTITSVRDRVAKVAEIVRVLPVSVAETDAAPGGLSFALFLVTDATDAAVAEAAGTTPESVMTLTRGVAAPASVASAELDEADGEVSRGGTFVRVDVNRLDDSLEALSALVVTRFKLARAVAELGGKGVDVRTLTSIVTENGRQLRELRAAITRMRMVPVHSVLERAPLLVRGLGRATGKKVTLEMETGEAALDKGVAERVFPVVVHLLGNAVDHGIESPEVRRAAGKPEGGKIRIGCHQLSNSQLELTVSDDGRGISRREVAARAGVPVPKDDAGLLDLIMRSGVSTAERVTTTSGRGVGMDIVKRIVVSDLGGEIALETTEGTGTTFKLRIPLSITIIDAFSFSCCGERLVTPVAAVEEIVDVEPERVVKAPRSGRGARHTRMFDRRGSPVPLVSLERMFGSRGEDRAVATKALIVRNRAELMAFEIDRVLGQQEVVVRPLEDPLVRVRGVSGATDLGDGRPTLVVDLAMLGDALMNAAESSP